MILSRNQNIHLFVSKQFRQRWNGKKCAPSVQHPDALRVGPLWQHFPGVTERYKNSLITPPHHFLRKSDRRSFKTAIIEMWDEKYELHIVEIKQLLNWMEKQLFARRFMVGRVLGPATSAYQLPKYAR
jgi:hypothetical protein